MKINPDQVWADAESLENLVQWLVAFDYAVNTCGNNGKTEMEKIRESAPAALRAVANYIDEGKDEEK